MQIMNFIFPGITVTVEGVPEDKQDLMRTVLANAESRALDLLENAGNVQESFRAAQRRINAMFMN